MAAFQSLNRSSTIICIRVRWNHTRARGCTPGVYVLTVRRVRKGYGVRARRLLSNLGGSK